VTSPLGHWQHIALIYRVLSLYAYFTLSFGLTSKSQYNNLPRSIEDNKVKLDLPSAVLNTFMAVNNFVTFKWTPKQTTPRKARD